MIMRDEGAVKTPANFAQSVKVGIKGNFP